MRPQFTLVIASIFFFSGSCIIANCIPAASQQFASVGASAIINTLTKVATSTNAAVANTVETTPPTPTPAPVVSTQVPSAGTSVLESVFEDTSPKVPAGIVVPVSNVKPPTSTSSTTIRIASSSSVIHTSATTTRIHTSAATSTHPTQAPTPRVITHASTTPPSAQPAHAATTPALPAAISTTTIDTPDTVPMIVVTTLGATTTSTPVATRVQAPESSTMIASDMFTIESIRTVPIVTPVVATSSATTTHATTGTSTLIVVATSTQASQPSTGIALVGHAPPNTWVTLYLFSTPIVVTVKTDASGVWHYTLTQQLDNGNHVAYVAMLDARGHIVARSAAIPFVKQAEAINFTPPTIPTDTTISLASVMENNTLAVSLIGFCIFSMLGVMILGLRAAYRAAPVLATVPISPSPIPNQPTPEQPAPPATPPPTAAV